MFFELKTQLNISEYRSVGHRFIVTDDGFCKQIHKYMIIFGPLLA